MGESYAAENRLNRLLEVVLQQKLTQGFQVGNDSGSELDIPPEMNWIGMDQEKQSRRWSRCYEQACIDYQHIGSIEAKQNKKILEPSRSGLTKVYTDLLCYNQIT